MVKKIPKSIENETAPVSTSRIFEMETASESEVVTRMHGSQSVLISILTEPSMCCNKIGKSPVAHAIVSDMSTLTLNDFMDSFTATVKWTTLRHHATPAACRKHSSFFTPLGKDNWRGKSNPFSTTRATLICDCAHSTGNPSENYVETDDNAPKPISNASTSNVLLAITPITNIKQTNATTLLRVSPGCQKAKNLLNFMLLV